MKVNTYLKITILLFLMYIAWQFGRIHDDNQIIIDHSERNHILKTDRCAVETDTMDNPKVIWYRDMPYIIDQSFKPEE